MKNTLFYFSSLALTSLSDASSVLSHSKDPADVSRSIENAIDQALVERLVARAYPDSPSGGYAPAYVDCPAVRPTIRKGGSLSANETAWLPTRRNNTVQPMIDFLTRANISGFDASSYITSHANNATALPNIALAISGGGYRAMLNGAGFVAAADSRTTNSTNAGQIGGLLQASTYFAGLSGGNWLVSSMYINNFSSVQALRDGSGGPYSTWDFTNSIFLAPPASGLSIANDATYYTSIKNQVASKVSAGFDTSVTDYWGRALSYQMFNASDGGASYTWSSISESPDFMAGNMPFPIVVADGRAPGTLVVAENSTVFEFNPFELGSWDPTGNAFAPLRYIGSNFTGGIVPAGQQCVRGFDQAGYVMGTSSSLFNQFLLEFNSSGIDIPSQISSALESLLQNFANTDNDIAAYHPNPFYLFNNGTAIAKAPALDLVDGGEDDQNVPLNPLIQPERAVDVIFAIDSSADTTTNWPDGASLMNTYERSLNVTIENGTPFPAIPDTNTFINLGLNSRPTFFGCDAANTTTLAPLIVYLPNAPYVFQSNITTFTPSYNDTVRNLLIQNGYDMGTQGNATLNSEWPTCVACAVLSRSFYKTGTTVPAACTSCFNQYCWNGTLAPQTPGNYSPAYKLTGVSAAATSGSMSSSYLSRVGFLSFMTIIFGAVMLL